MARRTVLTGRQRSALFSLPQHEADLLRHYTLSDEDLQEQYREWRDALPQSLAGSATAELLEQVCDLDLSVLEAVELPRGFGRDG